MKSEERIKKLFKKSNVTVGSQVDDRILGEAIEKLESVEQSAGRSNLWRTIMKTKMTKFAAAAVIVTAVLLSMTIFDMGVRSAYAIEQTIEAYQGMRFIHTRNLSPPSENGQDMWLEFDAKGNMVKMRVEEGEGDAFRIMIWADDTIKWYSPPKNKFVVMHKIQSSSGEIDMLTKMVDPKYAVQLLYDLQLEGKMELNIEPSDGNGVPIILTATALVPVEELPRVLGAPKQVLLIDPSTKLATHRDTYILKNDQYELYRSYEFLEYNELINPEMFELEQPEEVELEDRTQGIGMSQGEMTDAEAAAEVVRQYIEAWIAEDYEKAGKLYNGIPEHEVRQRAERLKIKHIRVIGIGEPVAKPKFLSKRRHGVPFAFLIELPDGRFEISGPWGGLTWTEEAEANLDVQTHRQAMVRPVVGQPDRWVITGGI